MAGNTGYKNKWQVEHCDRMNIVLPKGRKAEIQAFAKLYDESSSEFMAKAADERMERLRKEKESNAKF